MSTITTIIRGVVWSTIGSVLVKIIVVGNIFYILSHLSVYEYGLTELVFSVVSVLGIFLLPGIFNTIVADMGVEDGRENYGKKKGLFIQFVKLQTVLGIIAWSLLFFGAPLAAHFSGNESIEYFLKIVSFSFLVAPARAAVTMLSTVTIRFVDQSLFLVVEELSKFVFLVVFLGILKLGPAGLLYSVVCAQAVAVFVYIPRTLSAYGQISQTQAVYTHRWWQLVREHRKWSMGTTYLGNLGSALRLWIIRALLGTEAVGLFAFAYGVFGNLASLMPLSTVLKPIIPKYIDNVAILAQMVQGAFKLQLLNAVSFIFIAFLTLPLFIRFLFPQYVDAIPLVLVMLLALVPSSVGSLAIPVFEALKEQRSFFFATVFKVCVMIVLLPILILSVGILGIGIEVFLTLSISSIERYWRLGTFIPSLSFKIKSLFVFDEAEKKIVHSVWKRKQKVF